ncbi:MAG TPA: type II toxin-antitoxin system RelE/ParE family toxin [bacterium]|nr:type II toxin-antitoxin system RelE/ParE family toxin [bacterium]
MSYDLRLDPRVIDYLKTLDAKPFRQIVRRILELSRNPRPNDSEQLQGYRDPQVPGRKGYRLDQGECRVLYTIDDAKRRVVVFRTGHRQDVYKQS